jgi:hypothetical protein
MPLSTTCAIRGSDKQLTVAEAKKLSRKDRKNLVCLKCKERVTPHKASADGTSSATKTAL